MKHRTTLAVTIGLLLLAAIAGAQILPNPPVARHNEGSTSAEASTAESPNYISKVDSQEAFESISRTYHVGASQALAHAMFVIDRRDNKVFFVNTQKFRFHKDFLLSLYLVPRGADIFKSVYVDANRRFFVGTIAWQTALDKFTWELWEGDAATGEMIKSANDVINAAFFQKVYFKPNSIHQDDVSAGLGIDRVSLDEINRNQTYLALNTGSGTGRIHIVDKLTDAGTIPDTVEVGDNEIIVLRDLPISLPPVRGIIVAKPSSPLSHINILAKGWNIPNVYVKDADTLFKAYDTHWYKLDAEPDKYKLEPVEKGTDIPTPPDQQIPPANLAIKRVAALREMRAKDSVVYGSKSANLGEMLNRRILGLTVPDGFTIPFYWYKQFMEANGLDKVINDLMDDNDFVHNPRVRRQKLAEFRTQFQNAKFDDKLRTQVLMRWKTQLGGRPVFVRSSSNSEDLPNFSGAGLYSSVPNVREADKLIEAVKTVWASLWNFEAYDARVRNYVSQTDVYMSALIQVGIDMEKGGVMITSDPLNSDHKDSVYISAVCGHNTKVTGNDGIPEQVLYDQKSNSVVVMTLSQQKGALRFDEQGDLKETTDVCAVGATKRVLTDLQARSLARSALKIRTAFGGKKEQDIEWGLIGDRIYIVQARPYIDKK